VRWQFRAFVCISFACISLALVFALASGKRAVAGQTQEMLPEESSAKGRQVARQVINALGGQTYLNVHDTQCDGRAASFGTAGTLMGFSLFRDSWVLPDKNRIEFFSKGEHTILGFLMGADDLLITHGGAIITVYNGQEGWSLDKSGVSNQPDDLIKNFNEQIMTSMNNVLRKRMNEPSMDVEYVGPDLIDLREAEWIEFNDSDHRTMRLGIDKYSHLPLRWIVSTRDPETRVTTDLITAYTQYMLQDGVKTPLSIELSRNDRKVSQTFLSACKYNTDLSPSLFTRAELEQHAAEVAKKGYRDPKNAK
jgi:hypothetical protein